MSATLHNEFASWLYCMYKTLRFIYVEATVQIAEAPYGATMTERTSTTSHRLQVSKLLVMQKVSNIAKCTDVSETSAFDKHLRRVHQRCIPEAKGFMCIWFEQDCWLCCKQRCKCGYLHCGVHGHNSQRLRPMVTHRAMHQWNITVACRSFLLHNWG